MVLNGSHSSYTIVEYGVPQGLVLGPLLFPIYINDIARNIISNIKFFADDTMFFSIVKDLTISAVVTLMIHRWAHQWKMNGV